MELTHQQKKIAREIAQTLDDMESLSYHEDLIKQYSESYLQEKLDFVMSLPRHKIKRSRAAYYIHLVNKNARSKKHNSRS